MFPILIGQVVDRSSNKMEGFYRVAGCLILLTILSLVLNAVLLKNDQRYYLQSKYEDPREFEAELKKTQDISGINVRIGFNKDL